MIHRPFGLPTRALLATALTLIWFQPPSPSLGASPSGTPGILPALSASHPATSAPVVGALLVGETRLGRAAPSGGRSFSSDTKKASRSDFLSLPRAKAKGAEGAFSSPREALSFSTFQRSVHFASSAATVSQAPSQTGAITEIRTLFADYIKLHAAKKIDEWRDRMFLTEAIAVQTLNDGKVNVFQIGDLAKQIAEDAKALDEQHEVFEDVRIEVYGNAAQYATGWRLFQNGKEVAKGRAFFSLVKKEGTWRIASLVWYRE